MSNGSVIFTDFARGPKSNEDGRLDSAHCFERVGLGKAPFRIVGYGKGHTCCNYCGTPILYTALIESADGKQFRVGSDCVFKTGDGGLVRAIKNSAGYRQIQRERRADLDQRKSAEIEEILSKMEASDNSGVRLTAEGYRRHLSWCGMAGRARLLKELRQVTIAE